MRIGQGEFSYKWIDNWAKLSKSSGWAHHGMCVTSSGNIVAIHPSEPMVMVFDKDGEMVDSFSAPIREGHQLALSSSDGEQRLWIADPGRKNINVDGVYDPIPGELGGQVISVSFDGEVQQIITQPAHAAYKDGTFAPTSVTVFEKSSGGNGDVWVADGYGESYVHRLSSSGELIGSISGDEGQAGRFDCPHGVWIDYRKSNPELYIADRSNKRVQVYDLEGSFVRSFGSDVLNSPSAFAIDGSHMIVAELRARLAVFDLEDVFVTYIGENKSISRVDRNSPEDVPGWPNNIDENGNTVRSRILEPGKFNSPHGIATDPSGNIYSGEWLIGGRYTKLEKFK